MESRTKPPNTNSNTVVQTGILTVLFQLLLFTGTDAQNRGVIFIGNSSTDLSTEFFYRSTEIASTQRIPIFAAVFSNAALTAAVPKTDTIEVYCILVNTGQGYTQVTFQNLTLSGADDTGSITHVPKGTGRVVLVQCTAESTTSTCPISPGGAEFCPESALSNVVSMRVLPAPKVTQCQLAVTVIATSGTFDIRLSETAEEPVTVTCGTVLGSGALSMTINSVTVPTGTSIGQVSYSGVTGNAGTSVSVRCTANSATQFSAATSTVDASTAVFTREANTLSFEPTYLTVFNTTFTSFLVLQDSLGVQRVSVSCGSNTATSLDAALSTATPSCTNIQSSGELSLPWRVQNLNFELVADAAGQSSYYKAVTTNRLQRVTQSRTEVIVTWCCVTSPASLAGLTATSYTVAHLAPFVCETCNTTVENPKEERIIQNPGYVEVATCLCDLTENACDYNCCCDEECSTDQKFRFSTCIPGLPGGQPADAEEYKCKSGAFNLPDWHLVTCVYWENNAYLGMYYKNRARISESAFSSTVAGEYKGMFSFSLPEMDTVTTGYTHGVPLNTIREDFLETSVSYRGAMTLPRPAADGTCSPHQSVKFLIDQKSSCTSTVTRDTCSALSAFSGRIYAISSSIAGCSQSLKVTSTLNSAAIVPTDVRYRCATDITSYTPSTVVALNNLADTQRSNFGNTLIGENCSTPCSNDNCINYNIGRSADATSALPGLCSWDDGATASRVPTLDATSTRCDNVVLSVKYLFEWSGSQIVSLTADVILGSVSLNSDITQQFEVEWKHKTNGSVYSLSDNFSGTSDAYQRSGSAGYEPSTPLYSGCPNYNPTGGDFAGVGTDFERQIAVWRPGVDGLCANARREDVNFGEDVYSSCALRLTADDLETGCDQLRENVFNHLNVLMPADVIGRYGYNNPADLTMWIPVTRQTLNATEDGVPPPAVTEPETFRTWADSIRGNCRLPSAIKLNVMYTQTGEVNGYPRLEVVGAHISYEESTWSMDCQGAQASRCRAGSTLTQNFLLSSSVQFTKVDTTTQDSKTRFHTRCDPYDFSDSPSCERYFSHVYRDECFYETCWQELAYPILPAAERGPRYDWRLKALPAFLTFVLGVVGYVSVTRPGWS